MESTTLTLAGGLRERAQVGGDVGRAELHAGQCVAFDAGGLGVVGLPGDVAQAGDVADRLARLVADDAQGDGFAAQAG